MMNKEHTFEDFLPFFLCRRNVHKLGAELHELEVQEERNKGMKKCGVALG